MPACVITSRIGLPLPHTPKGDQSEGEGGLGNTTRDTPQHDKHGKHQSTTNRAPTSTEHGLAGTIRLELHTKAQATNLLKAIPPEDLGN